MLSWSLSSTKSEIPTRIKTIRFEYLGQTATLSGRSTDSLCIAPRGKYSQRLAPYGRDSFRLGARRHSYGRLVQPDRVSVDLVREWLQKCEREHRSSCFMTPLISADHNLVPEYVIDVQNMRVHEVCGKKIHYLALSYVWGRIQTLQLLRHNRAQLVQTGALRDRIGEIPAVLRDAITFTQALGFQFLWADTLCICQDDIGTKERQIAAMNIVYSRAAMTLVALEGHDASYGLPGVTSYQIPRHQPMETVHQVRLMTIMPPISGCLDRSVWCSRAWTFQEEQFSRRLLFFTNHQVYFRCQSSTYCEDRFEDCQQSDDGYVEQSFQDGILIHTQAGPSLLTIANRIWQKMVEDYSKRKFSHDSDRYDAFIGIETELKQDKFQYPCVLGMPVKHLVRELYWHHARDSTNQKHEARRISNYSSWSWCGWEGGVVLPRIDLRVDITKTRISGESVDRVYNESGQLQECTATPSQPVSPLLISSQTSKQPITLAFEACVSKLRLDASRFAEDGILLVAPEQGKICGLIYAAHLPLESLQNHNYESSECLLISSCHRSSTFEPCDYLEGGSSEFETWFSLPKAKTSENHAMVSEIHDRNLNLATRRLGTTTKHDTRPLEPSVDGLAGWDLTRRLKVVLWTNNPTIRFLVIIPLAVLAFCIALSLGSVLFALLTLFILIFLVFWVFQLVYNAIQPNNKWFLWDSLATTRFGEFFEETVVHSLPMSAQDYFYRIWSSSSSRENSDEVAEERSEQDRYNVANIMLTQCRIVNGARVHERLAIGEMSAQCWRESQPIRQQIILE